MYVNGTYTMYTSPQKKNMDSTIMFEETSQKVANCYKFRISELGVLVQPKS